MLRSTFLLVALALPALAANKMNVGQSQVTILGTSNVHDWTMTAKGFHTSGTLSFSGNNVVAENFKITFPVSRLESGKSLMDDYAQEALMMEEHPNIVFQLSNVANQNGQLQAKGKLTIAGKTRSIAVPVVLKKQSDNYTITGKAPIKMTDYGVEPPSVMFGTMTTGDEVTIQFQFAFN